MSDHLIKMTSTMFPTVKLSFSLCNQQVSCGRNLGGYINILLILSCLLVPVLSPGLLCFPCLSRAWLPNDNLFAKLVYLLRMQWGWASSHVSSPLVLGQLLFPPHAHPSGC